MAVSAPDSGKDLGGAQEVCGGDDEPIANKMGDLEVHGWITAASERKMAGLEGQATFEDVHGSRQLACCIRQQSAEAPRLRLTMAMQIL